jgi:hypothetical protein
MKTIILITKEDIQTTPVGKHIQVATPENSIILNFTRDALEELLTDYEKIKA